MTKRAQELFGKASNLQRFIYKYEGGLKKWLYRRGLPFKTEVLLLPVFKSESTPVIMTTWKMVSKYAGTFFTGDNLVIVDSSLSWCLYYHHDGILHFACGRKY